MTLIRHITQALDGQVRQNNIYPGQPVDPQTAASVILLLGSHKNIQTNTSEPCLIFNKRSSKVRQPGDLCFPGGSITPRFDAHLSKFFSMPFTSLGRWKYWTQWQDTHPQAARCLSLLWATALRESFEEMRLNPLGVTFLGPLPPQSLVMFRRVIYPMVAWVRRQKRFFPNWEVEKIIHVPLREMLDDANYRRYRLSLPARKNEKPSTAGQDYPYFYFLDDSRPEILWGATYRIATLFMEFVFGFRPPATETLPVVEGRLDSAYMTGYK